MKSVEFIYQDTQIHFALGNEGDVMVNATEMAKVFGKRIDVFLKTEPTKAFINLLEFPPQGGNSSALNREEVIKTRGQNGTYFHRILALKFAAWLDPEFELWVYSSIDKILFGNYKEHWDAHIIQSKAEKEAIRLEIELKKEPTKELVDKYFETIKLIASAKTKKRKAIANQLKIEF